MIGHTATPGATATAPITSATLPDIAMFSCGPDFPQATLAAYMMSARALIDGATHRMPRRALQAADAISRRWLAKAASAHLAEIDAIAEALGRPGAYFLSVNYEWGCTVAVRPVTGSAELVRVLDWRTPGLGRHLIAALVEAEPGRFLTLTWPGYTGVLQAMAPGRFAAAINQAPMPRRGGGLYPLDWLANKIEVWRSTAVTPAHLLRDVFETAATYEDARRRLIETPMASPAIFSLAGCRPADLSIIERLEGAAHVHDGARAAANAWQAPAWRGRARGLHNADRMRQMTTHVGSADGGTTSNLDWLAPPILNDRTRLAAVFTPASGRVLAQGFAGLAAATKPLEAVVAR